MKLKHIFENTPQQPKMTAQQILAALKDFRLRDPAGGEISEQSITIDDQDLIHIHGILTATGNTERMPLQLESVNSLIIYGLNTLAGLPRQILYFLDLSAFMGADLTSATEVFIGTKSFYGELGLLNCPNLKTLEGIDNFKPRDQKIKIMIDNCENLAFDPYPYAETKKYIFVFQDTIPHRVQLIDAVTLTTSDQISFRLEDKTLEKIINDHRGKGPADMIPLARKLIAAGYTHHVRPT
jgi:hypothetical protein